MKIDEIFSTIRDWASSKYAKKSLYDDTSVNIGREEGSRIAQYSFCFGDGNSATGNDSVSLGGFDNKSTARNCVMIGGIGNTVSQPGSGGDWSAFLGGFYNHAQGSNNVLLGGNNNRCNGYQVITGHYNDYTISKYGSSSGTSDGTAFCIGNGTSSAKSNAARIDYNGKLWCKQAYSTPGADYAEYFEWEDGNPDHEDRRGYFVTLNGDKIRIAKEGEWILGVVSGNPCVIGNTDTEWQGQFMRDEFGAFIKEIHKETVKELSCDEAGNPILDKDGNQIEIEKEVETEFYKINPDYDSDKEYIFRDERKEWDTVGMVGVLPVRDDGTCMVNGFCQCVDGGIATASETGYRVIKRVTDNVVKIVLFN